MSTRKNWLLSCFVLLTVILTACNSNAAPVTPADKASLVDTTWELSGINANKPVEGPNEITIAFTKEQVQGNSGCNSFGGSYNVNENSIQVTQLASTMMACMQPAGVMDQEQVILQHLNNAETYRIEDGHLIIVTADQGMLTYEPVAK